MPAGPLRTSVRRAETKLLAGLGDTGNKTIRGLIARCLNALSDCMFTKHAPTSCYDGASEHALAAVGLLVGSDRGRAGR